jgi:hypothetical protein
LTTDGKDKLTATYKGFGADTEFVCLNDGLRAFIMNSEGLIEACQIEDQVARKSL